MGSGQVKAMVKFFMVSWVLVALVAIPAGYLSIAGEQPDSLKIGVLAPKTGFGAPWAAEGLAGLKVAEEEIKSLGGVNGVPVEFIVYDTATRPQEAIQMMKN